MAYTRSLDSLGIKARTRAEREQIVFLVEKFFALYPRPVAEKYVMHCFGGKTLRKKFLAEEVEFLIRELVRFWINTIDISVRKKPRSEQYVRLSAELMPENPDADMQKLTDACIQSLCSSVALHHEKFAEALRAFTQEVAAECEKNSNQLMLPLGHVLRKDDIGFYVIGESNN